jgi:nicotinamide riboside kinase
MRVSFTGAQSTGKTTLLNKCKEVYRDYKFVELGRFDYTKEDCYNFHDAVKQHIVAHSIS